MLFWPSCSQFINTNWVNWLTKLWMGFFFFACKHEWKYVFNTKLHVSPPQCKNNDAAGRFSLENDVDVTWTWTKHKSAKRASRYLNDWLKKKIHLSQHFTFMTLFLLVGSGQYSSNKMGKCWFILTGRTGTKKESPEKFSLQDKMTETKQLIPQFSCIVVCTSCHSDYGVSSVLIPDFSHSFSRMTSVSSCCRE